MRKLLPFFLLSITLCHAQDYGLNEYFENESVSPRWTTLDLDGDGKTWRLQEAQDWTTVLGFSGYVYISDSFDTAANLPLNPNNVLVSPTFIYELPRIKNGGNNSIGISFRIAAADAIKFSESYAVYLLPVNQTFSANETPIYFETLTSGSTSRNIFVDRLDWEIMGKEMKLYFRHFNSPNQKALVIDDIRNFNTTMSVNDVAQKNKTVISPNPAKHFIKVNLKDETVRKLEIIDISGRAQDVALTNGELDVRKLNAGIYFIRIDTDKSSYVNKFIKE